METAYHVRENISGRRDHVLRGGRRRARMTGDRPLPEKGQAHYMYFQQSPPPKKAKRIICIFSTCIICTFNSPSSRKRPSALYVFSAPSTPKTPHSASRPMPDPAGRPPGGYHPPRPRAPEGKKFFGAVFRIDESPSTPRWRDPRPRATPEHPRAIPAYRRVALDARRPETPSDPKHPRAIPAHLASFPPFPAAVAPVSASAAKNISRVF